MTQVETQNWQRGIPLDKLKALAGPFKERHKPLVFGAFGLTKERDVADAIAKDNCIWTGNPPQAVAIASVTRRPSEQQDFAQRGYTIPVGCVYVKNFAAVNAEAGTLVLNKLRERGSGAPLVVEIFEEDSVAKQSVGAAELGYACTKISAGSEIKGVYTDLDKPLLPALPKEDAATLLVLKPGFLSSKDLAAVRAELEQYGAEHFAQHYSDYNKRKSWTSFALRGYSDDPHFIIKPAEMSKAWKDEHHEEMKAKVRWTPAVKSFPHTEKACARLGLEFDRVRFMRLRSKDGELSRHADITDREAGTQDKFVARLHVPIITSDAVTFYGWTARGERIATSFPEGALCYLDQRKPHAVTNRDPKCDRVHLVLDCFANAGLRKLIAGAV